MIQCVRWPKATHIVSDVIWLRAKKLSKIFSFFFIIALSFSLSASAHSGRTDGNGGHYNRSTGEYHYHHGYPAHSHYDIDGDGTIDCPYNFDDQTNHDSGKTSSNTGTPSVAGENGDELSSTIILIIVLSVLVGIIIVCCIAFFKIRKKKRMKEEERLRQEEEQQRLFEEEKNKFDALYGGRNIYEIINAPNDSEIGEDGLPRMINERGWGSKYTFYISRSGYCFHSAECRYLTPRYSNRYSVSCGATSKNAYLLAHSHYHPCSFCKPVLPDTSWVGEYKQIMEIKKKYDIDIDTSNRSSKNDLDESSYEKTIVYPSENFDNKIYIYEWFPCENFYVQFKMSVAHRDHIFFDYRFSDNECDCTRTKAVKNLRILVRLSHEARYIYLQSYSTDTSGYCGDKGFLFDDNIQRIYISFEANQQLFKKEFCIGPTEELDNTSLELIPIYDSGPEDLSGDIPIFRTIL